MDTFDTKTEAVIEKIRKLMALAENNDNEHQAESAANKARELLEAYNLDMAIINRDTHTHSPRSEQNKRGGLYNWQRNLWNEVAGLNFCKYWYKRGHRLGGQYEHQLLGSKVNVIASTIMSEYLQDTIERLARDWVHTNRPGKSVFIKEAIAFREGMSSRLVYRLWSLRNERLRAEREKAKAEREANAARGIFTENALVLADVISNEEDLNNDHICGWPPGTSAKNRKDRELRQAEADRQAEITLNEYKQWAKDNPEEAARKEAYEKRKQQEYWDELAKKSKNQKQRYRRETPEEERRHLSSYRTGYAKGDEVSLNQQVTDTPAGRLK